MMILSFSSPHGDFFILTVNNFAFLFYCQFSSPHGDFFILTAIEQGKEIGYTYSRPLMGISLY